MMRSRLPGRQIRPTSVIEGRSGGGDRTVHVCVGSIRNASDFPARRGSSTTMVAPCVELTHSLLMNSAGLRAQNTLGRSGILQLRQRICCVDLR